MLSVHSTTLAAYSYEGVAGAFDVSATAPTMYTTYAQ